MASACISVECTFSQSAAQVFHVWDGLFLGTEHGATSAIVFDTFDVRTVINLTSGSSFIPNAFEHARGIRYINYQLVDQPGENILTKGIREGTQRLSECLAMG